MSTYPLSKKIGILGGGQLGKMLCEAASPMDLNTHVLDKDWSFPAATIAKHFVSGDFKNAEDVFNFGKDLDCVTIEIESVSTEGLRRLAEHGVKTYPGAEQLEIIKDKGKQNEFYHQIGLPSPEFHFFDSKSEILSAIKEGILSFPFVQKLRTEGYDGRGVELIHSEQDLPQLLEGSCITEQLIHIKKELAVIAARNASGEIKTYDPVEMVFKPKANLVEFLQAPAKISDAIAHETQRMASKIIRELDMVGILAIEFFLDHEDRIYVNEAAPRPHNSGHHTIEACFCSQYEQLLRCILDLPLGSTRLRSPGVMLNILGAEGHTGPAVTRGAEEVLKEEGTFIHLYGKKETRPNRKMGHLTVIRDDIDDAVAVARKVKDKISITT